MNFADEAKHFKTKFLTSNYLLDVPDSNIRNL